MEIKKIFIFKKSSNNCIKLNEIDLLKGFLASGWICQNIFNHTPMYALYVFFGHFKVLIFGVSKHRWLIVWIFLKFVFKTF